MRYIGCKRRLLPFIHDAIVQYGLEGKVFCDLFSGTATVGEYFKQQGFKIISSDLLYCSYVQQQVKIKINDMPSFENLMRHLNLECQIKASYAQNIIDYLNQLEGVEGFVYKHYSPGGTKSQKVTRLYYTDSNARKIDVIRETVEGWWYLRLISEDEFYILLYALLNEASNCANTTATMNGFLKKFSTRSLRPLQLKLPELSTSHDEHEVYCQNGITLLDELDQVDILYLDPPYTKTQYAASYHLLETIARWDNPTVQGVLGKRDTTLLHSSLNRKREVLASLEQIISSHCYRHLLMSYSSDSLISHDDLLHLFKQYGEVVVRTKPLKRYQSMSFHDPRANPQQHVEERLYYLKPYSANANNVHHMIDQTPRILSRELNIAV